MSDSSLATNSIAVDDTGVITIVMRGPQTQQTMQAVFDDVKRKIEDLKAQGKEARVLTDVSGLDVRRVDDDARREARALIADLPADKSAIYGRGTWLTFIMYLVKATGKAKQVHFFSNKREAIAWLMGTRSSRKRRTLIGLLAGILISLIGVAALVGWQFDNAYLMRWVPSYRPINPVSAVGVIIMGLGFMCYWARKMQWLRAAGVFSLVFGIGALLPFSIDYLLFGGKVQALGTHAQVADSAAVCFIVMGVVALVAGRKGRWVQPVEYVAVAIMGGLSIVTIFGQLYFYDWIYTVTPHFVMAYNLAFVFFIASVSLVLLVIYRKLGVNVLMRIGRTGWLIAITLFLVQVVTYGAWLQANARNESNAAVSFTQDAEDVQDAVQDRLSAYVNALYGFQGLFLASSAVSQAEFDVYYNTTHVAQNYPGLRALSFISKVDTNDLAALTQKMRNDTSLHKEGNPTFVITQQTPDKTHYILTYVAATTTNQLGIDLGANPTRRVAYRQAERTRKPVASGTIEFAATATAPASKGFFISVPVAYGPAPNKIIGFVNAVFNYENFFADTFADKTVLNGMNIKMIDTLGNNTVLDRKSVALKQDQELSSSATLSVADRMWKLELSAPKDYKAEQNILPLLIMVGGQLFSVLLIVIFWVQGRGRRQALGLVEVATKDLQKERNLAVENDQKSTAILSSIGDGVFAIDNQGVITVLNPAAQAIVGISDTDAIGKKYNEVLRFEQEKTGKISNDFITKALEGHLASMAGGTMLVRENGTRIPVADSAAPIWNAEKAIIGAIIVFRDISKEHELDKAKTEFVSLASHQLRTPLSAINWYGELLLNGDAGKLNKDQHEYIKEIFEGSQRMVELVNSLLDVSRIEVGKLVNQPAPIKLQDLISSLEKELEVSIEGKKLIVKRQVALLSPVVADPKQLRMIIQNILSNAVKYTSEKGEVSITLRNATQADMAAAVIRKSHDHYWYFSVKDTGYGIPKAEQAKIFGKLFRADNVQRLDVEGTGLGLYIVKEVVEKMGGKVWFESTEGKGTTFYVVAPMQPRHMKK